MTLDELLHHPLLALLVTIGSYLLAQALQRRFPNSGLLNPVVIAIAMVVVYIVVVDIPYEQYLENVNLIHALLGPATVALAIPLYEQLALIRKSARAIIASVLVAAFVAALGAYYLAAFLHAPENLQMTLVPKSVTTPIAIGIAHKVNIEAALVIFFVFVTGITGSLLALPIFKALRIRDDKTIGLSLGITCHGLGVARALQVSEKAGAFAAIGMSLMGIVSGILLPLLILWVLR